MSAIDLAEPPLTDEQRKEWFAMAANLMASFHAVPDERRHIVDILGFMFRRRAEVENLRQLAAARESIETLQLEIATLQRQLCKPS